MFYNFNIFNFFIYVFPRGYSIAFSLELLQQNLVQNDNYMVLYTAKIYLLLQLQNGVRYGPGIGHMYTYMLYATPIFKT